MPTVIPFPAERLGDPGDALFLALMRSDGSRVAFGEVVELPGHGRTGPQDNAALEQVKEAVLF
jgi:hypothetical protein